MCLGEILQNELTISGSGTEAAGPEGGREGDDQPADRAGSAIT